MPPRKAKAIKPAEKEGSRQLSLAESFAGVAAGKEGSSGSSASKDEESECKHDKSKSRFSLMDGTAFLDYQLRPKENIMDMWETFVPRAARGKGVAVRLCTSAFEYARTKKISVLPSCSYIRDRFLTSSAGARFVDIVVTEEPQDKGPANDKKGDTKKRKQKSPAKSGSQAKRAKGGVKSDQASGDSSGKRKTKNIKSAARSTRSTAALPPGCVPLPHHPILFGERWQLAREMLSEPLVDVEALAAALIALSSGRSAVADSIGGLRHFLSNQLLEQEQTRFWGTTLPFMQRLVLQLPKAFEQPHVKLLSSDAEGTVHMTRHQTACCLAASFFCLHAQHRPKGKKREKRFRSANFEGLWNTTETVASQAGKLRCLLHYFDAIRPRYTKGRTDSGLVTFHRRLVPDDPHALLRELENDTAPLRPFETHVHGAIEDGEGTLQVDFANRFLGGGVLHNGSIQEEIRFVINPECLVGLLFTEVMGDNESVIIIGAERFSDYSGYSRGFTWAGPHKDKTPRDGKDRIATTIVAIDALQIRRKTTQFTAQLMLREIGKAYCGFSVPGTVLCGGDDGRYGRVSTGNWGCGAFGGDLQLKAMLQWIAASKAGKGTCYYTFGEPAIAALQVLVDGARERQTTVSQLWRQLQIYGDQVQAYRTCRNERRKKQRAAKKKGEKEPEQQAELEVQHPGSVFTFLFAALGVEEPQLSMPGSDAEDAEQEGSLSPQADASAEMLVLEEDSEESPKQVGDGDGGASLP